MEGRKMTIKELKQHIEKMEYYAIRTHNNRDCEDCRIAWWNERQGYLVAIRAIYDDNCINGYASQLEQYSNDYLAEKEQDN
jgi:hypothetical protein